MRMIDADALIPLIKMGECNMYDEYCQGINGGIQFAVNQVKQMPTIEKRKIGKWKYNRWYVWECSECGGNPTKGMGYVQGHDELYSYCPNCGARMVQEGEDDAQKPD